jgi:hypothetical protein
MQAVSSNDENSDGQQPAADLPRLPDARSPKMTATKLQHLRRSLRNAKILLGKQKRIIKEQRELICSLKKCQKTPTFQFDDSIPAKQFILGQLKSYNCNVRARRYSSYDKNFVGF